VAFAAAFGLAWVAEHIIEVGAVSAVCGALAVSVVVWLLRLGERRDALQRDAASIWTVRADALPPPRAAAVGPAGQRAIGPAVINLNFYGEDGEDMAARVIRTIPRPAGDAITERETNHGRAQRRDRA
jgi:hypothetical protein